MNCGGCEVGHEKKCKGRAWSGQCCLVRAALYQAFRLELLFDESDFDATVFGLCGAGRVVGAVLVFAPEDAADA